MVKIFNGRVDVITRAGVVEKEWGVEDVEVSVVRENLGENLDVITVDNVE